MAHHSRLFKAVVDVPAGVHDTELAFWQAATGQALPANPRFAEYHGGRLADQEFCLLIQRTQEGSGRVHLDIHTDDLAAEVDRLERLGATPVREVNGWWIMRDPAGLLFCVIPQTDGTLTDANSHRWD